MNDRTLVDTSAFYAYLSPLDTFHERSRALFARLFDHSAELFTSSAVLWESMGLIHRRLGFAPLEAFVEFVRPHFIVVWLDADFHWRAWDYMSEQKSRALNFVDCTTVVLARALNIRVLSFDEALNRHLPESLK